MKTRVQVRHQPEAIHFAPSLSTTTEEQSSLFYPFHDTDPMFPLMSSLVPQQHPTRTRMGYQHLGYPSNQRRLLPHFERRLVNHRNLRHTPSLKPRLRVEKST